MKHPTVLSVIILLGCIITLLGCTPLVEKTVFAFLGLLIEVTIVLSAFITVLGHFIILLGHFIIVLGAHLSRAIMVWCSALF